MDIDALRQAADANLAAAFDLVRVHLADARSDRRRFGAVEAIATGHELAFYNPVLVLDASATPTDVLAAVRWIESQGLRTCVHLAGGLEEAIRAPLESRGFAADDELGQVMALSPIPPAPAPPGSVRIRVGGPELGDAWHQALESGERFRRTFGPALLADPAVRIAVADLDGTPVAAAAAIRSAATLGIYAVGTVEPARRRGFGRAVTWAAIESGAAAWGSTVAILQSSEMGVPLYRSMGFADIGTITLFMRPSA
jgi:GNAT superfamily N-acetyltransferase